MQPSGTAVEARGLTKVFHGPSGAVYALDNVSLAIGQHQFFTLLGPSGCGKTTLLRLIAGFEQPTQGEILLGGVDIARDPPYRRPVNTVFQSYALFPHLTVARNISFGLEMHRRPTAEIAAEVKRMLSLVRLEGLDERYPDQLSGGQQQRVALARALANRPRVLLLDEPLSALDLKLRKEMQIELKRLQHETGVTFVFVTHDQQEALTMSDRIAVMDQGQVLQVGAPSEVYEEPVTRFVADFVGETNMLSAELVTKQPDSIKFRLESGRSIAATTDAGHALNARVTLAIRPERADIALPGNAEGLPGRIERIVYLGTDTQYHVRIPELDAVFLVRRQNIGESSAFAQGDEVAVAVAPHAVRVLRD